MAKWNIFKNDISSDNGGFSEWWEVSDGARTFKCDEEAHAQWLLRVLEPVDQPPDWLRDELAARAMQMHGQGLMDAEVDGQKAWDEMVAARAYKTADAMLAARVAPRE